MVVLMLFTAGGLFIQVERGNESTEVLGRYYEDIKNGIVHCSGPTSSNVCFFGEKMERMSGALLGYPDQSNI